MSLDRESLRADRFRSLSVLLPDFNVKNPEVVAAIRGLIALKQPYLGVFL